MTDMTVSSTFEPISFEALVKLASDSAHLRVLRGMHGRDKEDRDEFYKSNISVLSDSIFETMRVLGRRYRQSAQDLRSSRLFELLESREEYERLFEYNRRIEVTEAELTPLMIYTCLKNRNILLCRGWAVEAGIDREYDDDFGQPCWGGSIELASPDGAVTEWVCIDKDNARAVYAKVTGHSFTGHDTLGYDAPHPAEYVW